MNAGLIDAGGVLDHVRPLVLVVDEAGRILSGHGGAGGFLGRTSREFTGRHVLDLVAPSHRDSLVGYFSGLGGPRLSVRLPMPFRTRMVDRDGREHDVDVIPTGCIDDDAVPGRWVVVLVPLTMQSHATRALDAELAGEPRQRVRALLCDELAYENDSGRLLWFYVDLSTGAAKLHAPTAEHGLTAPLRSAIERGWRPWETGRPAERSVALTYPSLELDPPAELAPDASPNGRATRMACIPLHLDGDLAGAYLQVGSLPALDRDAVTDNVRHRVDRLVDVTRLLEERWRDRDRLVAAATRDSMTGVANRDAFHDALAAATGAVAVLYVDVDRFKSVNDRWGHAIGDRVLVAVAERISEAVRPSDVVARFGGDEFVVLLSDVDDATAVAVGERVLEHASTPLGWGFGPDAVTVSVGLAPAVGDIDVVDAADRAMLRAKREGRARLVHA